MSFQAFCAHIQRLPYSIVAVGVEAVERGGGMAWNAFRNVVNTLAGGFRAANFDDKYIVTVGNIVLSCRQASQAFIADIGRCRWIGAQVADCDSCEKRFVASHGVNDRVLNLSWLFVNLAGDFHA